jgi:hypothetical protein
MAERATVQARWKLDDVDFISADSLPCSDICKTIFRHVQQLGKTNFHDYRGYIGADLLHKPWRERDQMRRRARFIARWARKLDSGKEPQGSTQSFILQSEILARLSVEVDW